jgi:transcriptional regulator
MYIPLAFAETDQTKLFDFIESHSFGLLISAGQSPLCATHVPLLVERDAGPRGRLVGHLAKANPHWRQLADQEVLVVFSGAHAYISPTWYQADNVVPTWNYVAVHAYGKCSLVEDQPGVTRIIQDSVKRYERSMPRPWTIDSSTPFFERLATMVVGIRIDLDRLEGKWKLGQNHSASVRQNVAESLAKQATDDSREIARLMADTLL